MAGRKKNTEIRCQAFQDYLKDMSFEDIAKKYNRPVPCVENWSLVDKWLEKKESAENEASEKVLREFKKDIQAISKDALAGSRIVARLALKRLEALEKNDAEDSEEVRGWSRLLVDIGAVQKNLMPTINVIQIGEKKASSNLQSVLKKLMR